MNKFDRGTADTSSESKWRLSSNGEWIDPKEYPYLVDWVNQAKKWVQDFRIYEFIRADNEGFDPTGQVTDESEWTSDLQSKAPIPAGLIWSSTGLGDFHISTELSIGENRGDHMVFGWYIGEVPHETAKVWIPSMMHVCKVCLGTGWVMVPENYSMEARDPQMKFDLRADEDGIHFVPLDGYSLLEDEWEVEYDCREKICKDSWIYLEDTNFKVLSD